MPCGADRAILARVTAGIVAQICVMCYYKILSGNEALSIERKRHGCFEDAGGDCRCGDARLSIVDGEQLSSDRRQAEFARRSKFSGRVDCPRKRKLLDRAGGNHRIDGMAGVLPSSFP